MEQTGVEPATRYRSWDRGASPFPTIPPIRKLNINMGKKTFPSLFGCLSFILFSMFFNQLI